MWWDSKVVAVVELKLCVPRNCLRGDKSRPGLKIHTVEGLMFNLHIWRCAVVDVPCPRFRCYRIHIYTQVAWTRRGATLRAAAGGFQSLPYHDILSWGRGVTTTMFSPVDYISPVVYGRTFGEACRSSEEPCAFASGRAYFNQPCNGLLIRRFECEPADEGCVRKGVFVHI